VIEWSLNIHMTNTATCFQPLSTCKSWDGTATHKYALHYPGSCQPDANVFRWLEQHLCETASVIPMAHTNASCPQTIQTPANVDATIAVMEWELWSSGIGTIPTKHPWSNSWRSVASITLLVECTPISMITFYRRPFANGYNININTLQMNSFYLTYCW
jgi:hypothetical protein